jgi:hypothetical protein
VAISEVVKKVKFVYYLFNEIHIKIKLSIVVRTNNTRAIFRSENASTGSIHEFIENGFTKIEFAQSKGY